MNRDNFEVIQPMQITTDSLIAEYGDRAYRKCSELIIEYAYGNAMTPDTIREIATELARRGYR